MAHLVFTLTKHWLCNCGGFHTRGEVVTRSSWRFNSLETQGQKKTNNWCTNLFSLYFLINLSFFLVIGWMCWGEFTLKRNQSQFLDVQSSDYGLQVSTCSFSSVTSQNKKKEKNSWLPVFSIFSAISFVSFLLDFLSPYHPIVNWSSSLSSIPSSSSLSLSALSFSLLWI